MQNDATLPDELNEFYAQFQAPNPELQKRVMETGSKQNPPFMNQSVDVGKSLRRINLQKVAGPDNIPGEC